ncbi:filamentous hemagglutinin N-terminal domain-containing protein [Xylophilus rhododendri]|uniref:Filamentous hemagglutinin N-terminal domain-containing protein n=1 Tax=Xylophilus rhododendri TaxID=2697032 RepID=A0A857JE92_9BURK|nr:filamentous hemagglutinin N-terminal domain-containing protein [Xylophilus rhododendri]QHJ00996.1 filamentous hemagglutinin N-terminal domain-containing protein [Xylophilus rhododendri]
MTRAIQTRRRLPGRLKPVALALACMGLAPAMGQILPTNPTLVGGSATVGTAQALANGGLALGINQTTNRAILNWQSFSIGALDQVNVVQQAASAVLLNRVTGLQASTIAGKLTSMLAGSPGTTGGSVYLINPNGVTFANGAVVNTGGLLASTMDIDGPDMATRNATFMTTGTVPNGARAELSFAANGTNSGRVTVEQGASITAVPAASTGTGGAVTLLGASVSNAGTINADRGSVNLGAAANVTLIVDPVGDGLTTLRINSPSAIGALVENTATGSISADGGVVALRAASTAAETVVRQAGVLRARTLGTRGGQVVLDGSAGNTQNMVRIESGSSTDAMGTDGAAGGSVTVNAQLLRFDGGSIDASGSTGGSVTLSAGNALAMGPQASIAANGSTGVGGTVRVQTTSIETTEDQFGANTGAAAHVSGQISARGATDGGSIYTGAGTLEIGATAVIDAAGGTGANGRWTLDSGHALTIANSDSGGAPTYSSGNFPSGSNESSIADLAIGTTLGLATDVVINSQGKPAYTYYNSDGVQFDYGSSIAKTQGRASTLTVNSDTTINMSFSSAISAVAPAGALNVNFNSDASGAPLGAPDIQNASDGQQRRGTIFLDSATIATNGGDIRFYGQSDAVNGRAVGGPPTQFLARLAAVNSNGSQDGIQISGSTLDTCAGTNCGGTGAISLRGQGATVYDGSSYLDGGSGVVLQGTVLQAGSGGITLDGRGGLGANGVGIGLYYTEGPTVVSSLTSTGNIAITGSSRGWQAGDPVATYSSSDSAGVAIDSATLSAANIAITGTGGDTSVLQAAPGFASTTLNYYGGNSQTFAASNGVALSGSSLTAGSGGNIAITGTAGSGAFIVQSDSGSGNAVVVQDAGAYGVAMLASATNGLQASGGQVSITAGSGDVLLQQYSGNATQFDAVGNTNLSLIDTSASGTGNGGNITITGRNILIQGVDTTATLDARGQNGGNITVRGTSDGGANASGFVALDSTTSLLASGGSAGNLPGNGGNITVLGDTALLAYGLLQARGGSSGGNGGTIETSGGALDLTGLRIDAGAPAGTAGKWVIDPFDVGIVHGNAIGSLPTNPFVAPAASTIQDGDINRALNAGTSVTIGTGATGSGSAFSGDITFDSGVDINYSGNLGTLTLQFDANRSIRSLAPDVTIRSTGISALNVVFNADANNSGPSVGGGQVSYDGSILTNGGNVTMKGNWSATGNGDTGLHLTGLIDTRVGQSDAGAGGNITLTGLTTTPVANPDSSQPGVWLNGASLFASTGNVTVTGSSTNNTGVRIDGDGGAGQGISTTSGNIVITGLGTDRPGFGSGPAQSSSGVETVGAVAIGSTTGAIALHGRVADTAKSGSTSAGVHLGGNTLVSSSVSGDIDLTGSATANGLGLWNEATVSTGGTVVLRAGNDGSSDAIAIAGTVQGNTAIDLRPGGVDASGAVADRNTDAVDIGSAAGTGFALSAADFSQLSAPAVIVGSSAFAGNIGVNGALSRTGALALQNGGGGNITIDAPLSATGALGLLSGGNITQTSNGAITAPSLLARSTGGNVDLQNVANNVALVGGGASGSFSYVDADQLAIAAVSAPAYDAAAQQAQTATAGQLTSSGATLLRTVTQDLVLQAAVNSSATVDLVAGGLFRNSGNNSVTASRWNIWSSSYTGEIRGGLAGNGPLPNLYGCTYLGTCAVTVPATGNHFIYTQRPTATVTVADATRVEGTANPAFSYGVSGTILGDTASSFSGTPTTTATASSAPGSYAIGGSFLSTAGYLINLVPGRLVVTAAPPVVVPPPPVVVPPPVVTPVTPPASLLARVPLAEAMADTSDIHTYTFDRNIGPPPICAATGPLDADRVSQGNDVLAREWSRVRSRPNLASCVATERRNGCADF